MEAGARSPDERLRLQDADYAQGPEPDRVTNEHIQMRRWGVEKVSAEVNDR